MAAVLVVAAWVFPRLKQMLIAYGPCDTLRLAVEFQPPV
jgi:hypothetical protein